MVSYFPLSLAVLLPPVVLRMEPPWVPALSCSHLWIVSEVAVDGFHHQVGRHVGHGRDLLDDVVEVDRV